jgi:hypothetical protein
VTCREVHDLLFNYSTSELPGDVAHGFRDHVSACAVCARDVEDYHRTVRLARDAYSDEPVVLVPLDLVFAAPCGQWGRLTTNN